MKQNRRTQEQTSETFFSLFLPLQVFFYFTINNLWLFHLDPVRAIWNKYFLKVLQLISEFSCDITAPELQFDHNHIPWWISCFLGPRQHSGIYHQCRKLTRRVHEGHLYDLQVYLHLQTLKCTLHIGISK